MAISYDGNLLNPDGSKRNGRRNRQAHLRREYDGFASVGNRCDYDDGRGTEEIAEFVFSQLESTPPSVDVTVVPANINELSSAGGTVSVAIEIGGNATGWFLTENLPFLSPSNTIGTGNGMVTLTYTENTTADTRAGNVRIRTRGGTGTAAAKAIRIRQLSPLNLSWDTRIDERELPFEAGSIEITVTLTGRAMGWRVASTAAFIVPSESGGTGSGIVTLNYAENTTAGPRTASIVFVSTGESPHTQVIKNLMVGQLPPSPTISLTIDPTDLSELEPAAGKVTVNIDIGGGAQGWQLLTASPFLIPSKRTGTRDEIITINYPENLTSVTRSATVSILTTGGGAPQDQGFTFTQLKNAPPSLDLSTIPRGILPGEGGTLTLNIDIGGTATGWMLTETPSFLTPNLTSGKGDGTVSLTYPRNMMSSRMGDLAVTTTGGTGSPKSKTLRPTQRNVSTQTIALTTPPSISLGSLPAAGGTVEVTIDVGGSAMGWELTENLDFVSPNATSGAGDGTVTLTYTENTGASRMGNVVIATTGGIGHVDARTLTLTQLPPAPTLVLMTPPSISLESLPAEGGTFEVTIDIGMRAVGWMIDREPQTS